FIMKYTSIQPGWWLHGGETEQLQKMVLHHVTKRTRFVVKIPAPFHTHGFSDGDLHVINVVAVPQGLEQRVGEANGEQVLHGLFAEVMVNAINLILAQDGGEIVVDIQK